MEYMKVFVDFAKSMETLADAERGRLFVAMLQYAASDMKEEPELSGNERHVWPTAKLHLDRSYAEYVEICKRNAKNGAKGGRPKNPAVSQETHTNPKNPVGFQETQKSQDKEKDKDKEKYNIPPLIPPEGGNARARFVRPTRDEVAAYCRERGNNIDAQRFFDYYESNGWRVGKSAMKDWRAAVRTWERGNDRGGTTANQRVDASFSGNAF